MNKNTVVSGIPYVSVWDGGVEVESTCTIDFRTGNILDIEPAKGLASFGFLDTLDREYIVLNDEQVDVMEDDEGVRWVRLEHAQREAAQNEPDDEPVIDSKFPGIAISLTRPGAEIGRMLALTEFCSGDNTDCPDFPATDDEVITRVWGDGLNEDYTTRVVHENIEKFFEQEKTPVPMGVDKVVSGLKDLIKDRKSFIHEGDDDPYDHGDNPFRHDVAVLETAIALITAANEWKDRL